MTESNQDQLDIRVNESVTASIAVTGDTAETLAGLRALVDAAESAGLSGDMAIEDMRVSDRRLSLVLLYDRAIPSAKPGEHRLPSALEIADALRAGHGRVADRA